MPYDFVPPLKDIYRTTPLLLGTQSIGDRDEECGMLKVGDNVTPRDPKGEGGCEGVKISKIYRRYYFVHEKTRYC